MDTHLSTYWIVALSLLAVWEVVWKGIALWRAAHRNQLTWFVALLIINSAGLLPIIYLLSTKERSDES